MEFGKPFQFEDTQLRRFYKFLSEDIIEFIFGGGGSDHEFMRLIEGVQNR